MTEPPIDPPPLPPATPPEAPPGTQATATTTTAPGFPTWKQSIILIVSGAVLGLTTCFGFLIFATSNPSASGSEALVGTAIVVVALCALTAIVGVLMLLWLVGRALLGKPTR